MGVEVIELMTATDFEKKAIRFFRFFPFFRFSPQNEPKLIRFENRIGGRGRMRIMRWAHHRHIHAYIYI